MIIQGFWARLAQWHKDSTLKAVPTRMTTEGEMIKRRRLLFLTGGLALWVAGFRFVPQMSTGLGGFDFRPLERVPGFRTLSTSDGATSSGGGGFDILLGLTSVDPLPAGLMERVTAAPEDALFKTSGSANATPVAYFFDYYCPYCRVLSVHLDDLAAAGEISVTRQHWPVFGEASILAARASLAAEFQGDAEGLHDRLLRTRGRVTPAFLRRLAEETGLSWTRLKEDMESPDVTASLDRARALAQLFAFIGTPSLVVGRTVVEGEISKSRLRTLARMERSDA